VNEASEPSLDPVPGMAALTGLRRPPPPTVELRLDGNEGLAPNDDFLREIARRGPRLVSQYPTVRGLEEKIAARFGIGPERVGVFGGADEALDRLIRSTLCAGRSVVCPTPTFEMLPRYFTLAGAAEIAVPWMSGPYPRAEVIAAIRPDTALLVLVSPQNPTGAVATADDVRALSAAIKSGLLIVDLAYAEFADEDLSSVALSLPNTVIFRTFSKAWGLAGMRIGYAMGPERVIDWMRAAGSPFTANALGVATADFLLDHGEAAMRDYVERIKSERRMLFDLLTELGARPLPSQGNFLLVRCRDATAIRTALFSRGIAVKEWTNRPELAGFLRITCPGRHDDYARLEQALRAVAAESPVKAF
jgi:histidinol-phosphate aminotransferase